MHDYLYRQYFNMEWCDGKTCCGGFAVLQGETRYSSVWLNCQKGTVGHLSWDTDGNKMLSTAEQALVNEAILAWKQRGRGEVVGVPDHLHHWCMNVPASVPAQASKPVHSQNVYAVHVAQVPPGCEYGGQGQVNQPCGCTIM